MINLKIVFALMVSYFYYWKHSLDRIGDSFYWPVINLLLWGLTSVYIKQVSKDIPQIILIILSGVVFWLIIWRASHEITVNLLEEFWNRNLINLFSAPVRIGEWIVANILLSILKTALTIVFAGILAYLLYAFNIFTYGFLLIPFIASLFITGWFIGLFIAGIIIRLGHNYQTIAWIGPMLISPFAALYYPVSTLPDWAQIIAKLVPASYILEGMREILFTGNVSYDKLFISFALNGIYLILSIWFFVFMFNKSRKLGLGRFI